MYCEYKIIGNLKQHYDGLHQGEGAEADTGLVGDAVWSGDRAEGD